MENLPHEHLPFEHKPGEKIGSGYESIVRELGPDWVIKEINPYKPSGEKKSSGEINFSRSPERIKVINKNQERLEEIFGKEHFARTYFVKVEDKGNKDEYVMVQKRIKGTVFSEVAGIEFTSNKQMVESSREDFKNIIWGVKKATVELGVPMDIHAGNIMREEKTGRLVIFDSGVPSEEADLVFNSDLDRAKRAFIRADRRINRIREYEGYLELTEEERKELNEKYDLNDEDFERQVEKVDEQKERLKVSDEELVWRKK
ncbi:hypothetical protein ACFLZK_00080 [Patescibacteria group bacterium]